MGIINFLYCISLFQLFGIGGTEDKVSDLLLNEDISSVFTTSKRRTVGEAGGKIYLYVIIAHGCAHSSLNQNLIPGRDGLRVL